MEKTININLDNNPKKITKKKDDLQKKAEINAIMEKYNLKKSKLNNNKTN